MLQRYFSRIFSCMPHAMRLDSTRTVLIMSLRTAGLRFMIRIMSWYMLLSGSDMTFVNASRCAGNRASGQMALILSITLLMLFSGSAQR